MKFLVLGAGGAGAIHCRVLTKLAQEVCVYDPRTEQSKPLAKETGVVEVQDAEGDYDCTVVATTCNLHRELVERELKAGRKVVCEKPLALTAEDARAIAALPDVFVAESQAYCEEDGLGVRRMATAIEAGEFGWPVFLRVCTMTTYRPQTWCEDLAVGGGAFIEGGAHMLAVARILFGEAKAWFGSTRSFSGGTGPDTGTFVVDYEGDHQLLLQIAWGVRGCLTGACQPLNTSFGLFGPRRAEGWWPGDNHELMWRHLLKCLQGDVEPVATLDHAAGAIEDAWKCYEVAGVSL